jgi:hypothetical protein
MSYVDYHQGYLSEADGYSPELREMNRVDFHSRDYTPERFAKADTLAIRLLDDDGELVYEARATRKRLLD